MSRKKEEIEEKKLKAKYIGTDPNVIRIGDRPIFPNEIIDGPQDVVEDLLKRSDFEKVE